MKNRFHVSDSETIFVVLLGTEVSVWGSSSGVCGGSREARQVCTHQEATEGPSTGAQTQVPPKVVFRKRDIWLGILQEVFWKILHSLTDEQHHKNLSEQDESGL